MLSSRRLLFIVLALAGCLVGRLLFFTSSELLGAGKPRQAVLPVTTAERLQGAPPATTRVTLASLRAKLNLPPPASKQSRAPQGQPKPAATAAPPAAALGLPAGAAPCPVRAVSPSQWRQVRQQDLELMDAHGPERGASSCFLLGGAMFLQLRLDQARKVGGFAYELPLPEYIVADEPLGDWREKRSTLQLFAQERLGSIRNLKPLGPAHTLHSEIAARGNGAFSHWRHAITAGPTGASLLRFSTPGNVPLNKLTGLLAVVYLLAPPLGWVEFTEGKKVAHQEVFRELFLRTFPTVGASPHLVDAPEQVVPGTWYLWRVGGNHEFELPLQPGELYEKRLPYQIAEHYSQFEKQGGILFPPPESYIYYQNKVALARLFQKAHVKTPPTWVFENLEEAIRRASEVKLPVVVKDPYGFSSLGIQQAATLQEYEAAMHKYFADALPGVEAIVQSKVLALREARVTYIDGRPFHGYWRVRKSLKSASAASNMGGYQDFSFPLADIAPHVAKFANDTGVPVGGVDFIWEEAEPDVRSEPFCLEVSPTSDINPPSPPSWTGTYAEFKKLPGYHAEYLAVRRQWTDLMVLATIDRYRRARSHLFVDIDNVVSKSAARVLRWGGRKEAYSAAEVMKDEPVADARSALQLLRKSYFVRFLTARGGYEDAFNVTRTWLDVHGFEYDELIVVSTAEAKVAHMSKESLLVDDFTLGHENPQPFLNEKFMAELRKAGLPFIVFPFGGLWADVLPLLLRSASAKAGDQRAMSVSSCGDCAIEGPA